MTLIRRMIAAAFLAGSASLVAAPLAVPAQPVARCGGGFLEGIVVNPAGTIWAVDVLGGDILEIAKDGTCIKRARTGGMPNGARFAPDGSLTIADHSGLFKLDTGSGKLSRLSLAFDGNDLTGLNDIAYDQAGGLYITVPGRSDAVTRTGRVFYRSAEGQVTLLADGLAYPNGIAVSPDGETVAVAEFAAKRILSLPSVAGVKKLRMAYVFAHTVGGIGPDGILFDKDGRLITANMGDGKLHIFAPDGTLQHVVRPDPRAGSMPTNLAIDDQGLLVTEAERGEVWRVALPPRAK